MESSEQTSTFPVDRFLQQKQEVLIVLDNHGSTPPIPQLITEQSVDQSTCLLDIQQEVLPGPDSQSKVVSEEFGISDIQVIWPPPASEEIIKKT